MKTLELWILLLIVVMIVSMSEAQARNRRRRDRVGIRPNIKRIPGGGRIGGRRGRGGRGGRGRRDTSLQKTIDVDLPCQFKMYDTNKDGHASHQEVSSVLAKSDPGLETADILNAIFQDLDRNGDGMLQIKEFYSNPEYQIDCVFAETFKDILKGPLGGMPQRKNSA